MGTRTIATWGGVLVVALLIGLAAHVYVNRQAYHLSAMLKEYRTGEQSSVCDLFDRIDPTHASPLQYASETLDFVGMDKSELLELFGRPCSLDLSEVDEWIGELDEVPKIYDEFLHYGEDNHAGDHHVGDETDNLFFFINKGKVVGFKTIFP